MHRKERVKSIYLYAKLFMENFELFFLEQQYQKWIQFMKFHIFESESKFSIESSTKYVYSWNGLFHLVQQQFSIRFYHIHLNQSAGHF